MAEDKGFKPTEQKLKKAREQGKVLKSQLVTQWFALIGAALAFFAVFRASWVRLENLINYCFVNGSRSIELCSNRAGAIIFGFVAGSLLGATFLGVLSETLQVGFKLESKVVSLQLDRLNPAKGLQRLIESFSALPHLTLRFLAAGAIFFVLFRQLWPKLPGLILLPTNQELHGLGVLVAQFALAAGLAFLVCAGIDYLVQRRRFFRELSMSSSEIRRELRDQDGDPTFKAFRRSLHESLMLHDLAKRVRKAKVVVVEKLES